MKEWVKYSKQKPKCKKTFSIYGEKDISLYIHMYTNVCAYICMGFVQKDILSGFL